MKEIKRELQELVNQQKKTNRTLDMWTYRALFFIGMIPAMHSKDKLSSILGYIGAGLATVLQIIVLVEDIMDIADEFDDETELGKVED
jgi:hypothetical protein